MNTASTDLSQPPHKGRKLALMIGGGALTGFFGALGLMTLIDSGALGSLGFSGVASVRQGKLFEVELDETDPAKAKAALEEMSKKLLANTVIENYAVELDEK